MVAKRIVVTVALLLTAAGIAPAQPIAEVEPNGAPPGMFLGFDSFMAIEGDIIPGDVDFYEWITPGFILHTASVYSFDATGVADTLLGAFDGGGAFLSADDSENRILNSSHHFVDAGTFTHLHAVTGAPDGGFVGAHGIATTYRLVLSQDAPFEVEPNDGPAIANPMPPLASGATAMNGFLGPPDVDYYTVPAVEGAFVTAAVFDESPLGAAPMDIFLGVLDPTGALFNIDDDAGPALLSSIGFFAPVSGDYTFAVTGFPDFDLDGVGHGVAGAYRIVISVGGGGGCDDIDFNNDGIFPDITDLFEFLDVFSGGVCP